MNIFLCYRRADTQHLTDRIYERLVKRFGKDRVFKDVDSIPAGVDFQQELEDALEKCDIFLAVIGDRWLSKSESPGAENPDLRRLDDPKDFVRIEIETALRLKEKIRVIPILDGSTKMPAEQDLPPTMQALVSKQAVIIRSGREFQDGLNHMLKEIGDQGPDRFEKPTLLKGSTILVTGIVLLTFIGFITMKVLSLRLGVEIDELVDIIDYPWLGISALVLPLFFAAVTFFLYVVVLRLGRLFLSGMQRFTKASSGSGGAFLRLQENWRHLHQKWTPLGIAESFLLIMVIVTVVLVVSFIDLLMAIIDPEEDAAILGCNFRWLHWSYQIMMSVFVTVVAYLHYKVFRYVRSRSESTLWVERLRWASLCWIVLCVVVTVLPWGTFWNADYQRVTINGKQAYHITDSLFFDAQSQSLHIRVERDRVEAVSTKGYVFEEEQCFSNAKRSCVLAADCSM